MSDRVFFAVMLSALAVIASILLFSCIGCASLFWRDSELAQGPTPPRCHCCAVGSLEGKAQGCVWWVCDGKPCPETEKEHR